MVGRPGEVKDFAKKIKMEDARINLRKQQLEKIAQQRARAQAQAQAQAQTQPRVETAQKDVKMLDTAPEPATSSATTGPTSVPLVIVQPVPTAPAQNTLHPSLPLKPSSSPTPVQAPSPSPAPAPTPVTQIQIQPPVRSTPPPTPAQPSALPPDSIMAKHEESKHRWSWIALRTARDNYLQHFGKIGPGDIVQLEVEIEKEKREKEKEAEVEAAAAMKVDPAAQNGDGEQAVSGSDANSLEVNGDGANGKGKSDTKGGAAGGAVRVPAPRGQGDGDVKMEGL